MYKRSKIEMKKNIYFLILMLIIILLDQFSKMKILGYMLSHSEELTLLPFLNFTLVFNSGVAFGIFSSFGQVVPHIFSLIGLFGYMPLQQIELLMQALVILFSQLLVFF